MRYNLMGNAGHWFPGVNAAKFDDTKIFAACGKSPFAERIPGILAEAHGAPPRRTAKRLSQTIE